MKTEVGRSLLACAVALGCVACGATDPTEVVLVIDSDLAVPEEIDRIDVTVAGPSSSPVLSSADLTEEGVPGLPLTLTVYPVAGDHTPASVVVAAWSGGAEVLRREIHTGFVSGETRMLRVLLARRCLALECGPGQTCDETGCRSVEVAAGELPTWTGQPPSLEGPACVPAEEICNGADDDCDDMVDEGFEVLTDPNNCGECGHVCEGQCTAGLCEGERAVDVSAGGVHTCALRAAGGVACWGWNLMGQLGDGSTTDRETPRDVPGLENVKSISAGSAHTCALTHGGSVFCWGDNTHGELGDGTGVSSATPVEVASIATVVQVAAGAFHTCAVAESGAVHCWGRNDLGQLGDGTLVNRLAPVRTASVAATHVTAGFEHSCAVLQDETVACWGGNRAGQLGTDPVAATMRAGATVVEGLTGAVAVSAARRHTCAQLASGLVRCWGDNGLGQLGDGTVTSSFAPVAVPDLMATRIDAAVTGDHTCAVSSSGVVCWGANAVGQIGLGHTDVVAGPQIVPLPDVPDIAGIAAGGAGSGGRGHSCAATTVGHVLCWGLGDLGQLGSGEGEFSTTPSAVVGL